MNIKALSALVVVMIGCSERAQAPNKPTRASPEMHSVVMAPQRAQETAPHDVHWLALHPFNLRTRMLTILGVMPEEQAGILYGGSEAIWACVYKESIQHNKGFGTAYESCDTKYLQNLISMVQGACVLVVHGECFDYFLVNKESDWPEDVEHDFSDRMQGITHDENHWYITSVENNGTVAKYKVNADLSLSPEGSYTTGVFDPQWKHLGDMDHHDGMLYIAMEVGRGGTSMRGNAVGAIPTDDPSDHTRHRALPLNNHSPQRVRSNFPWIARDPISGYFFSSEFRRASELYRYELKRDARGRPVSMNYCGTVKIANAQLDRVQGGAFSPSGRLYLAIDPRGKRAHKQQSTSIKVVDMSGHRNKRGRVPCRRAARAARSLTDRNPSNNVVSRFNTSRVFVINDIHIDKNYLHTNYAGKTLWNEEVEGITVWDVNPSDVYEKRDLGNIHTILLNKDLGADNFWLKHHRLSADEL